MRGIGTGTSGSRCSSTTPCESVIEAGHRVFLEIGAHPILRRDIAACLNEKSVARNDAVLAAAGRSRASGAAGIARPTVYASAPRSIGTSFFRPRRRRSSCRTYPFQAEQPLAGIRAEPSDRAWAGRFIRCWETGSRHRSRPGKSSSDIGRPELSGGSSDRRLDRLSGRRICRDGARGGARNFRAGPLRPGGHRISEIPASRSRTSRCSAQVVLDPASSEFDVYVRADASDNSWDVHARGCVRQASRADTGQRSISRKFAGAVPMPFDREECYRRFADRRVSLRPDLPGNCATMAGRTGNAGRDPRPERPERAPVRLSIASGRARRLFSNDVGGFADLDERAGPERRNLRAGEDRAHPLSCHAFDPHVRPHPSDELRSDGTEGRICKSWTRPAARLVEVQGLTARPTGYRAQRAEQHALRISMEAQPRGGGPRWAGLASPPVAGGAGSHHAGGRRASCASGSIVLGFRTSSNPGRGRPRPPTSCAHCVNWAGHRRVRGACRSRRSPIDSVLRRNTTAGSRLMSEGADRGRHCFDARSRTASGRRCGTSSRSVRPKLMLSATLRREPAGGAPGRRRSAESHLPGRRADTARSISIRIHRPSASTICWCRRRSARSFNACRKEERCEFWRSAAEPAGRPASSFPCCRNIAPNMSSPTSPPRFTAHAQHKFAQYPFVQFRTLDIERDPLEQGFDAHSFDLIIASDVLHATKDLRKTLDHVKQLLGSGGTLVLVELTRPWLVHHFDLRTAERLVAVRRRSPAGRALHFTGSNGRACCMTRDSAARSASPIARTADSAQHSVILARGPQLTASPALAPQDRRRAESLAAVCRRRRRRPPERRSGARPASCGNAETPSSR